MPVDAPDRKKRALDLVVWGASGFTGERVVKQLAAQGFTGYVLDTSSHCEDDVINVAHPTACGQLQGDHETSSLPSSTSIAYPTAT